jgi:ABC-type nitrate/sulfonate/bicarbonate transport system substrate-binding protein
MRLFAKMHGLNPKKDLTAKAMGSTATRLAALKAGSIDVAALSVPWNLHAEQLGFRRLAYVGDFLEWPTGGYVASESTLQSKRVTMKKFTKAGLRALKLFLDDRAEAIRFIAKEYKFTESFAERMYASVLPGLARDGRAGDTGLRAMLENLPAAKAEGKKSPQELVDYSFLKEAEAELGASR